MTDNWTAIIVAKGLWQYTERCLNSMIATSSVRDVVYIDNGTPSDQNSAQDFADWQAAHSDVTCQVLVIPPHEIPWWPKPIMVGDALSACWNKGIDLAKGDRFLVLNNDVAFSQVGWLERFDGELNNPMCGVVGLNGMSWHGTGFVQGSIFGIRRDAWERVGRFDELLEFSCEEVDWNLRAQQIGFYIRSFEDLRGVIQHEDGITRRHYKDTEWWVMYKAHEARLRYCYKWAPLDGQPISIND